MNPIPSAFSRESELAEFRKLQDTSACFWAWLKSLLNATEFTAAQAQPENIVRQLFKNQWNVHLDALVDEERLRLNELDFAPYRQHIDSLFADDRKREQLQHVVIDYLQLLREGPA